MESLRSCVLAAPSQPRAVQCTPANFPAASTPARVSASLQTTSAHPQPLRLPGRWRSPESQVRIFTHSPATAELSLRDQWGPVPDLPGASSAPPVLLYTASGALGSVASTPLWQSPGLHRPAPERCPQGSPDASSQCLPCPRAYSPVLAVQSGSHVLQSCHRRKEILLQS